MNLVTSITRFFKNKNTVTILGVLLIMAILYFGYNQQLEAQTSPVSVPVALKTIQPGTLITSDDVTFIEVPNIGVSDNVLTSTNEIVGKYSNYNTVIPVGSMFYNDVVVEKDNLPNSAFTQVKEGDVVYNLGVDITTTFGNSMFPGDRIDIYMKAVDDSGQVMVGKLIENVEILAVKDSAGKNVFENSEDERTPEYLIFGVSPEIHILLRKAEYMFNYEVEVFPVPISGKIDEDAVTQVSSIYLKEFINSKTVVIPEQGDVVVDNNKGE